MTAAEFADWIAYNDLQPIGDERLDLLIAQLCTVIANFRPFRTKRDHTYRPKDFIPTWGVVTPPTPTQLKDKLKAALAAAAPRPR